MASTKTYKKQMPWGPFEHAIFDERLANIAAQWWAERFKIEDRRDEFRQILFKCLLKQTPEEGCSPAMSVYSDYDPQDSLLEAVQLMGIKCRGGLFSSDGLFPTKTGLTLSEDGELWAKEGYGAKSYRIDSEVA